MTKVMLSCGEPSGDLYAGALTTEIRRLDGSTETLPACAQTRLKPGEAVTVVTPTPGGIGKA